jgi:membrane-bound inhibitor of C-type lysozyme
MGDVLPLTAALLGGVDVSAAVILNFTGNFERRVAEYACEGGAVDPFKVTYVNAAPNFLAIVPVEGQNLVFVTVLAASGAKYAAGEYEWWTRGADASLSNLTTPDAEPLICSELSETP